MVVSGLPKMTPSLNDSLEELTGLRSCYTHVIVYYSKRVQIKISKGNARRMKSKRSKCKLPGICFLELQGHLILPAMMCDSRGEPLLPREAHLSAGTQDFPEIGYVGIMQRPRD